MQNRGYNQGHIITQRGKLMPKQEFDSLSDFGKRLVTLRKAAGYTQVELANEIGVTQRMISYYEGHTEFPPSSMLPSLAKVLGVSSDQLLGIKPVKKLPKTDTRLQRRMQQIEKMGTKEKRQVMQVIDTFIENMQLKNKAKA